MFPTQRKRPKPKFRVVTPSINPLSSPSLVNPNGAYLPPVNNPSTAAIGGTGGFGSGLPMGGGTLIPTPAGGVNAMAGTFISQTPKPIVNTPVSPTVNQPPAYGGYGMGGQNLTNVLPGQQYRSPNGTIDPALRITQMKMSAVETDFKTFEADMAANNGVPNFNLLPAELDIRTVNRIGLDALDLQELGYERDPVTMKWVNSNRTQSAPGQQAAPLGQGDFYGYQYNEATGQSERVVMNEANASFENQLRWDPIKKKYRKIGQIQADYGYLPNTNKKQKTLKQQRAEQRQQSEQPTNVSSSNSSYGNVTGNLNTATG